MDDLADNAAGPVVSRPEPLIPAFGRVSLTLLAGQQHVNLLGNVHGGR